MANTSGREVEIPRMFIIAQEGTIRDVSPNGRERIARRWFSYCDVEQASIV